MFQRRDEMGLDDVNEHGSSLLKLGKIVMEKSTRMTVSKEKVKASNADVDDIMKTPFALTVRKFPKNFSGLYLILKRARAIPRLIHTKC